MQFFLLFIFASGVFSVWRFIEKTKTRFMSWGAEQMKAGRSKGELQSILDVTSKNVHTYAALFTHQISNIT